MLRIWDFEIFLYILRILNQHVQKLLRVLRTFSLLHISQSAWDGAGCEHSLWKYMSSKYLGLLMKVIEESEKAGLKLNIQKLRSWHPLPITSWQMETVTDFIFLGSKITADGDCSHEIKRRLLLGRKAMTKLDSILKSRGTLFQQRSV